LQHSISPFISEHFNEVYTLYVQIMLLLVELEDKKTFMSVFALCHRLAMTKVHPDYQKHFLSVLVSSSIRKLIPFSLNRVVDFFGAYDTKKLWTRIREEFKPLAQNIFISLNEFMCTIFHLL
jgi:hypothetical protein